MGQKEKLIDRLKSKPKDFTFEDAETLLKYLDYFRSNKGKTSGSRVMFVNKEHGSILLHKPHPQKELKMYQIKQLIEVLEQGGTYMNNTIQYKGYVGSVEFSEEDSIFYGKVLGIRSLISYEGENAKELLDDFHYAIDDYLASCEAEERTPETAFKGSFNVRLSPELHKKLFIYTTAHKMSINKYVEETLENSPAAHIAIG